MLKTRITERYGLAIPFVSAGMSTATTPALVAAVAQAGGIGLHGAAEMPLDVMREDIAKIRAATEGVFGITIIPHLGSIDHVRMCAREKVRLVQFFWDDVPSTWISILKDAGVDVWRQVGSVAEAERAMEHGVDVLMVQGNEAGGHNRAEGTTLSMLPAVSDIAGDTPIASSGGIADGRAVAAVLALGADAAVVGTRLLATPEAHSHPEYKRRLVAAKIGDSVRTNIFGLQWNDATSRHLRTRVVREWEGRDVPGPYKVLPESDIRDIGTMTVWGTELAAKKFGILPPNATFDGDFEEVCMYAGESVGQTKEIKPASAVIDEIMHDAEAVLRNRLGGMLVESVQPSRRAAPEPGRKAAIVPNKR